MSADATELRDRLQRALGPAYTVERELGGGGMSRVFLADEHALARRVVIKVLAPEIAQELSAERFAREIRLVSQLQHPHIVPILTAGDADGMPYYTMPFVAGESLRAELARRASGDRLPLPRALDILRDVARALAYAHAQGIVHRDIKPENVLLASDAAIVADFGVAKATVAARRAGNADANTTLTQQGSSIGTPAYMSPEQAAGDAAIDPRADLYAWGVVAYELLAGAHPFADRTTASALVRAHLMDQPRPLAQVAPEVPAAISALVMRCLAKDPADRPASARELVDALAAPATSSSASPLRASRLVIAAIGVMAVSVAAFVLARSPARGERPAAAPPASAHDAFLRGKVRVSSENRADNLAAIAALRTALAADPALAPAHATLARAYAIQAFYFAADSERKGLVEDAEVEVEKALALDARLGEAHFARGLLLWTPARRFPHEEAVRAFRQALALDTTLDEAHHQLAMVYLHVGLFAKAQAEIERALALNPGNTLARFRLGVIDMYRGDHARALEIFKSTPLERNPSLWAFQEATAQFRLGHVAEATARIDQFLRDYPLDEGGVGHSVRAMMLAAAGRRDSALIEIAAARDRGRNFGHFHHAAFNIASAYALLGMREEAIRSLQDAADNGFPCYPLFASDTQLDALRTDPRFVAMMAALRRDWEVRSRAL